MNELSGWGSKKVFFTIPQLMQLAPQLEVGFQFGYHSTIFALFYAIIALHVVDVHIFLFVSEQQPLRQKFLNNIPAVFPFPHPPTSALVFSGRNIFKIQQITLQ